jgi:hypothetical protein
MNEGRSFVVETVETVRRLIHMCIILRNKLPSYFRWDDIIMRRVIVGRSGIRHDGVKYAAEVRRESRVRVNGHTDTMDAKKRRKRRMRGKI